MNKAIVYRKERREFMWNNGRIFNKTVEGKVEHFPLGREVVLECENVPYCPKRNKDLGGSVIVKYRKSVYLDDTGKKRFSFCKLHEYSRRAGPLVKKNTQKIVLTIEVWLFEEDFDYWGMKIQHE